jgi:Holliday junction resolvasome RuvABC endonuclease subunit
VAEGRKDPVAYEACFAIDPGVCNLGVTFVIRDHLDPKNLRLEFAQQVEFDKDTKIAVVAYRLLASMDAWLKNWNRYKLRADVRNRLQRVIVVVEQQYFSTGGKVNPAMVSFVHCLETAIIATRSQTEHEFKMIVVSPQAVAKYCGLEAAKKYRVRKAQTKAFVERGLNTQLERHDISDSIALAITALQGGKKGRVRLAPVEIGNTDFLFTPPDEEPELNEAGAKGYLHVSDEDQPGLKEDDLAEGCVISKQVELEPCSDPGCDTCTGVSASGGQPEEAAGADGLHAGSTCRGDGKPCGLCDDDDGPFPELDDGYVDFGLARYL